MASVCNINTVFVNVAKSGKNDQQILPAEIAFSDTVAGYPDIKDSVRPFRR